MENRGRTMVQFAFYKFDAAWRRQPKEAREQDKADFACAVEEAADDMMVRSYSTVGIRGDVDLLLWNASQELDVIQQHGSRLLNTGIGRWATQPYCYLSMTKNSQYIDPHEKDAPEGRRLVVRPSGRKYLCSSIPLSKRAPGICSPSKSGSRRCGRTSKWATNSRP